MLALMHVQRLYLADAKYDFASLKDHTAAVLSGLEQRRIDQLSNDAAPHARAASGPHTSPLHSMVCGWTMLLVLDSDFGRCSQCCCDLCTSTAMR